MKRIALAALGASMMLGSMAFAADAAPPEKPAATDVAAKPAPKKAVKTKKAAKAKIAAPKTDAAKPAGE